MIWKSFSLQIWISSKKGFAFITTEEKQLVQRCSSQLPLKQQVLLNQGCTAHLQKATDYHQEPHLFINNREGHLRCFTVRITSLILTAILEPLRQALLHLDNIISAQPVCQNPAAILKVTVCFSKISTTVWILIWKIILVGKIARYY